MLVSTITPKNLWKDDVDFVVTELDTDMKYDLEEELPLEMDHTIEVAESKVTSSMWLIPLIAGILGIFFFFIWKRRNDEDEEMQ